MYIRVALGAFLLLCPFVSLSSQNIFKNDLDESYWLFSGNAHQCRLSQEVDGFGQVALIADAGEPLVFTLRSNDIDGSLTFQAYRRYRPVGIVLSLTAVAAGDGHGGLADR